MVRSKLLIQHFEFKYSVVRVKVGRKIISDPRFRLGGEETCEYLREGRLSWLSIHLSIYREEWTFARRYFLSSTLFLSSSPLLFPSLRITEIGLYRADCREFDLSRKKRPTFSLRSSSLERSFHNRAHNFPSIKSDRFRPRFWNEAGNFVSFSSQIEASIPPPTIVGSFIE